MIIVVYTVPTSQSVVTVIQSDDSQQRQDDDERRQIENTNGLYIRAVYLLYALVYM